MIHVLAISHLLTDWLNGRRSLLLQVHVPTSTHHPLPAVLASLNYNVCAPAATNIIGYWPIGWSEKKYREKIDRLHIGYYFSFVRILRPIIMWCAHSTLHTRNHRQTYWHECGFFCECVVCVSNSCYVPGSPILSTQRYIPISYTTTPSLLLWMAFNRNGKQKTFTKNTARPAYFTAAVWQLCVCVCAFGRMLS